mmetsp:Transcript_153913/g.271761  ORF Transcript_153913/g.271761 Transcript_153913/m.271761 type:complete len:128 (+) Transcript_153913:82-465(+)
MFTCCAKTETQAAEAITAEPEPVVETAKPVEEPPPAPAPTPEPVDVKGVIVFIDGDVEKPIKFLKGPIGITFSNKLPIKVDTVKGHAAELGVKVGWLFKSIEGEPVSGKQFPELKATLVAFSQSLNK